MMKICLFSDVHGNGYAFEKLLSESSRLGVDLYIFCGDIFGYYYDMNYIISQMRSLGNLYCVKGNHDHNYLGICSGMVDASELVKKYGNSYKKVAEKISGENKIFIQNMQDSLELDFGGKRIGIYHGSPTNALNGRVYPNTSILESSNYNKFDYVVLGHTHHRMVKCVGVTTVINPGSVGQPRDKYGYSYAVLTIPDGKIKFHEIKWNRTKLIEDINKNDNGNVALTNILFRNEVSK